MTNLKVRKLNSSYNLFRLIKKLLKSFTFKLWYPNGTYDRDLVVIKLIQF